MKPMMFLNTLKTVEYRHNLRNINFSNYFTPISFILSLNFIRNCEIQRSNSRSCRREIKRCYLFFFSRSRSPFSTKIRMACDVVSMRFSNRKSLVRSNCSGSTAKVNMSFSVGIMNLFTNQGPFCNTLLTRLYY